MPVRLAPRRPPSRRRALLVGTASALVAIVVAVGLTGFHSDVREQRGASASNASGEIAPHLGLGIRTFTAPSGLRTVADVEYATTDDGTLLRLDVCSPAADAADAASAGALASAAVSATPRAGVLVVHGGAWSHGDKSSSDWHGVCQWLASEGFVAYDVDYSLAPAAVFPAAIHELQQAVEWIRRPANVAKYDIDPARVGVFGGSAGGNLAALLATTGTGSTTDGDRVAALAELSGPVDLTAHGQTLGTPVSWLPRVELNYLGCTSFEHCPQARAASAVYQVDPSDPPTFIAGSADEIVPFAQDEAFSSALAAAGVPHELVRVPGSRHSIGILDAAMRTRVAAFLHTHLDAD